jgi:formate hydrogenlyase subunit 3/multisubunit Na+/H+ antiporter MnhD subunit
MNLLLLAIAFLVGSGLAALAASHSPRLASALGAAGAVVGCLIGLLPAVRALQGAPASEFRHAWPVPVGALVAGLDPLSGFFLVPVLGLSAIAAVYGREYLLAYAARKSLAAPTFFFNLLVASMIGVVTARDAVLFLVAWEIMTLASYMLIAFEHENPAVKRAAWVYLIAAHVGVLCLFAMFLLLGRPSGGLEFATLATSGQSGTIAALPVFALALVGFGIKAGIVPFHVWLPEAHAAAPSHVSALMSGVVIKMGVYGLLRFLAFAPVAPWWGPTLMMLGIISALIGISLALYQRDIKRVLAYSSIENIGLIFLGIGVGLWGASRGQARLAAFGLAGGLLHLWNHALMKGLMFLSAGSVLHGAGTKDLERLGGLMKRMPTTGALMVVGAIAISGLPPLNGFVGEWLMYLGLIDGGVAGHGASGIAALLVVGVVALVGGLAALCFVRLIGIVLLGQPRTETAAHAHESSVLMTGPMMLLALGSLAVAIAPERVLHVLSPVVTQLAGANTARALGQVAGSTRAIGLSALAVWASLLAAGLVVVALTRRSAPDQTWGCGYAAPTSRMQYTGRSFSEVLAERLLPTPLRARLTTTAPDVIFPSKGSFSSEGADPFTRGLYEPFLTRWADRFARLRWLQRGMLHLYLFYILLVLLLALAWMSVRAWVGA